MTVAIETVDDPEALASAASKAGDWAKAAQLWGSINTAQPNPSINTRYALAEALFKAGDLQEAETVIGSTLARLPRGPRVLRLGARIAGKLGLWNVAADRWSALMEHSANAPSRAVLREAVGALCHAGRFSGAAKILSTLDRTSYDAVEIINLESEVEFKQEIYRNKYKTANFNLDIRSTLPKPQSISEVCQAFWTVEKYSDLLNWVVNGVHVWPLLRMSVFYAVTQAVGLYDHPHPALKGPKTASSSAGRAMAEASLGRDAMLVMATKKVNGSEPYSDAVRGALGDRALLLDRPFNGELLSGAVDFDQVVNEFREQYSVSESRILNLETRQRAHEVRLALMRELAIDVGDLTPNLIRRVNDFTAVKRGFHHHFEHHPIRHLFLTNAYGSTTRAVVQAARESGARTVELQHGFISQFHLGYSWPGSPIVPYGTDELWTFGAYWGDTTPLAGSVSVRVIGAPYVLALAEGAPPRNHRSVVFTSQGVIGRKLFSLALETARRRPDKDIIFRLHPNEELSAFERLLPKDKPDNFILSARTPNIFELLATAGVQVGAFSTTLFEGMALGTRTIVLDLPGAEYMTPVIRRRDVLFAKNIDELVARIDAAPLAQRPEDYYAPTPNPLLPDAFS